MVKIESLFKSFGSLQVLKGIDFEVKESEIVSIVGASGAGKSTLLHLIGTLDKPDSGRILIKNQDPFMLSLKKLATFRNHNIGFIFQFHHLLPEFTAIENICIPLFIRGISRKKAEAEATELLSFMTMSDKAQNKPSELSGGEQQRVAVARALAGKPAVILADEPSGNLDSATANELHKLFFELREAFGQTFIIVTHNHELASMSDRILTIKDGSINT